MTIHEALASFESQFRFVHPAGLARNRIISVRRHNVENNLEGETQFSIVPQLYKCPQGIIDGLDHCSCFTGDWSYSINQATFDVLRETHAATVLPLSGSSEQLRQELVSRRQNVVPTVVFILALNRYLFFPKILLDVGEDRSLTPIFSTSILRNLFQTHPKLYHRTTLVLFALKMDIVKT
ncbi:hypothetical protein BCR33DRAFT_267845 [Rhizoclosmatium globosum]|uniref:Uncharacterized protein n=1 Tax=Rhizoclosmatium globosum TaxID=329046 RepID=A0A1Y2C9J4_9FUNG|nr:hypothetical protein BCR33DRAFT_267845 [Rhizoclosmatium globosum]|eukprot:ORY42985.1 hypothetical protein BCR33DRAFT_267845 [Rhizoclosmatium globosum]